MTSPFLLAGQTLENLACETTPPCLPSFLASLSFSPFSHFNHIPTEGLRTEMVSQAQPSQQHRSQTPILQNFNTLKRRCAWAPAYVSSEQHLHGVNYNGPEGAPVVEGLPEETNGIGDSRKRQRQKHVRHWQQFTRAHFPGGRVPAKFGCQPIKLELCPLVHAYSANYMRVHLRISVYIKRVE